MCVCALRGKVAKWEWMGEECERAYSERWSLEAAGILGVLGKSCSGTSRCHINGQQSLIILW